MKNFEMLIASCLTAIETKQNIFLQYILFILNERSSHYRQTFLNRVLKFNLEVSEIKCLNFEIAYTTTKSGFVIRF